MTTRETAAKLLPALRMLHGGESLSSATYLQEDGEKYDCGALHTTAENCIADYQKSARPDIVIVEGVGTFLLGTTRANVEKTAQGKTADAPKRTGRLAEKIAVITGSAQGFGKGIAEYLCKEGAYVVIADMNEAGAKVFSDELNEKYQQKVSMPLGVNVTDEESVKNMMRETVLSFGGMDLFINNAGIVRAGDLETMQKDAFELVASVNYTAYFVCVKYASAVMKIQHAVCPEYMMDIVEINSKSGLVGSNKNFAYAGSKFGGIGLTQSFAMELVAYNIKVNAVCPGNFLDGPLWSDPEKGLFVQYLHAGKVPGAKTVADVRKFYEMKTPIHRGCRIEDVARAVFYIVEQKYETGQAVPVTGGQQMLN